MKNCFIGWSLGKIMRKTWLCFHKYSYFVGLRLFFTSFKHYVSEAGYASILKCRPVLSYCQCLRVGVHEGSVSVLINFVN